MSAEKIHGAVGTSSGHEERDANVRTLFLAGLGLAVSVLIILGIAYSVYRYYGTTSTAPNAPAETFLRPDVPPPVPQIQPDPHADLMRFRSWEDSVLGSYSWVSKDSGIVRIPIEKAMHLLLAKGLPVESAGKQ